MSDRLERLVVMFALVVVVTTIAQIVRYLVNRADMRALPDSAERSRLLQEIRIRRSERQSHAECLRYLRSQGLRKGVAEGLLIDVELEQPADITKPCVFCWNGWRCKYPGNWRESTLNPSAGRDVAATIQGLGGASITFIEGGNLSEARYSGRAS